MSLIGTKRFAALAIALVLIGCAATAPKEPIRLTELPKIGSEIVRIGDARSPDAQSGETVQMPSGQGTRVPTSLISPDPILVIKAFVNEYLEEKSVKPLAETFSIAKLDVAVLRGKGATVTTPPGAEGYLGYGGAAIGRLMFQAFEDAKAPNFVEAAMVLKSDARELTCAGRSFIDKEQTATATLLALRYAAYQCGLHLLP